MRRKRRTFSSDFKLKVILESLKERESLSELSQKFDLHQNQISKWKNDFLDNVKSYLAASNVKQDSKKDEDTEKLYSKIGKLQMENDFLKKKLL